MTITTFKKTQSLDDYIIMFEHIYEPIQNVERDFYQVLARLLESIAECSQYVNKNKSIGLSEKLPKVFAWYCSLVLKSGIQTKLSEVTWKKFPRCCPYCMTTPCTCANEKYTLTENASRLESKSQTAGNKQPFTLNDWQNMFKEIYPRDQSFDQKVNFSHLIEELGEVSEAYRIKYFSPTAIESELADILSWILGMSNLLDTHAKNGNVHGLNFYNLEDHVFKKYPGHCPDCSNIPCSCVSKQSQQKISELNVVYPKEILLAIESSKIEIQANFTALFQSSDAQMFLIDLKQQLDGKEITELRVKALFDKLVLEDNHKPWYQKITASGLAEGTIVNLLTFVVQSIFKSN